MEISEGLVNICEMNIAAGGEVKGAWQRRDPRMVYTETFKWGSISLVALIPRESLICPVIHNAQQISRK